MSIIADNNLSALLQLLPELMVVSAAITSLMLSLLSFRHKLQIIYLINQATLLAVICLVGSKLFYYLDPNVRPGELHTIAASIFTLKPLKFDAFNYIMHLLLATSAFIAFIYTKKNFLKDELHVGETYSLLMFSLVGMMLLVSGQSFLILYLGLELLALPLYALIALQKARINATEAALKYFIMGCLASAVMLFGVTLVYGSMHCLQLSQIAIEMSAPSSYHLPLMTGLIFIWLGIAFKLGAAPFHLWVPDVYEGAPVALTLFISVVPKIAGFGLLFRIWAELGGYAQLSNVVMLTAIASILIGTLAALLQDNIKRMLGYSAVANTGYMLLGVVAGDYKITLFYLLSYCIMTIGSFAIITALSEGEELEKISDYRGFGKRQPLLALIFMILMLSMAGLPPFIGFYAKFLIFKALLQSGFIVLVVFGAIMAVISSFYYLRLIKCMYFEEPSERLGANINCSQDFVSKLTLTINGFIVLWFGIYPVHILNLCASILN